MKRSETFLRVAAVLVLIAIAGELWSIRSELRGLRAEQVKNSWYGLSPDALEKLRQEHEASEVADYRRRKESSVRVEGSVTVDGEVEVSNTHSVEISNSEPVPVRSWRIRLIRRQSIDIDYESLTLGDSGLLAGVRRCSDRKGQSYPDLMRRRHMDHHQFRRGPDSNSKSKSRSGASPGLDRNRFDSVRRRSC
jgi:hypothetical protein